MINLIKAFFSTVHMALIPHCDHKSGVCIGGKGRECKFVKSTKRIKKDGVEIQRTDYLIEGEENDHQ